MEYIPLSGWYNTKLSSIKSYKRVSGPGLSALKARTFSVHFRTQDFQFMEQSIHF